MMNSRERVTRALKHQIPDRVPFDFALGFSPYQLEQFKQRTGQTDPNDYFGADVRGTGISPSRHLADYSAYIDRSLLPAHAYIDEWGQGHIPTMSDDLYHSHLEGYVYPMLKLSTPQDALEYPLPDIEADYRYEVTAKEIQRIHDRGLAVMAGMACTIFEVAWAMRSMELLLMDFMDNQEFAEVLLDRITAKRIIQAQRFAELKPDVIMFGDDIASQRGMLMSVPMWRKWLKPRLASVIAASKRVNPNVLAFYHSDGDATAIIPDLIKIGVEVLNPLQPECMDPFTLKKLYGDRLSFWGTLGTQSTLPFGSPDDVRHDIKKRCEIVGTGGGLLIAPTHMVEPEVPWENLVAFVESVKEYGVYR
jgi:uroporphyrinogen decarboxylase